MLAHVRKLAAWFPHAAFLSVYAALAFALLGRTPLWLDELQQLGNAWRRTPGQLLRWTEISPGAVPLPAFVQQLVLRVLGYSTFAARVPAACFGVLAGCAFAVVLRRVGVRRRLVALALFLFLPLQFRYALEARGYSQGLFCSVAALWLFLELSKRPSLRMAFAYFLAIAIGIYSQPFTLFPVAGQVVSAFSKGPARVARLHAISAAALACLTYLPWRWLQRRALESVTPEHDVFSLAQIRPLVLLHDFVGGGYVCTVCILALALFGLLYGSPELPRGLLVSMVAIPFVGCIATDALFSYFFADRQLLFAMPGLVLLAAGGVDAVWKKRPIFLAALLASFFIAASVTDWRDATVPKDDLARAAGAIASSMEPGACVIAAPPEEIAYYVFFHPELDSRVCREPLNSPEVVTVISDNWSGAENRRKLLGQLGNRYTRQSRAVIGHIALTLYRRR